MATNHVWGRWFKRFRLCINGYCSAGQYRNGRVFVARPERHLPCAILARLEGK